MMKEPKPYSATPDELKAIDEALAEEPGAEYVLVYGQPRIDGPGVIYETRALRARYAIDGAALRWAREIVPYECGLRSAEQHYLATPMVLWRIEQSGKPELVWESQPGIAAKMAGWSSTEIGRAARLRG